MPQSTFYPSSKSCEKKSNCTYTQSIQWEQESDVCIGCETGADCHDAHTDKNGNPHPACLSRCDKCK